MKAYERSLNRRFSRPDTIVIEINPHKITSFAQGDMDQGDRYYYVFEILFPIRKEAYRVEGKEYKDMEYSEAYNE